MLLCYTLHYMFLLLLVRRGKGLNTKVLILMEPLAWYPWMWYAAIINL